MNEPVRKRNMENSKLYREAESNGISPNLFIERIKLGWPLERAISVPPTSKSEIDRLAHEANKKYSDELIDLARKNGICYSTFTTRINKYGLDPLEAATKPVRKLNINMEV